MFFVNNKEEKRLKIIDMFIQGLRLLKIDFFILLMKKFAVNYINALVNRSSDS